MADQLAALGDAVRASLEAANAAREIALAACRRTIRACGNSIRAVHRGDVALAASLADDAAASLREAQSALTPYPALASAGPMHDAARTPRPFAIGNGRQKNRLRQVCRYAPRSVIFSDATLSVKRSTL